MYLQNLKINKDTKSRDYFKHILSLTQENHERWIYQIRIQFQGKGWFYTYKKTLYEYTRIAVANDLIQDFEELHISSGNGSATTKIRLNIDKKATFLKNNASALSYIYRSLSNDDEALVEEYNIAKKLWDCLTIKYFRINNIVADEYLLKIKIFSFDDTPDMTIIGAWDKLKDLRWKLLFADASAGALCMDKSLFQSLTLFLPDEYKVIINIIRVVSSTLSINDKIKHLQVKEAEIQNSGDSAYLAKGKKYVPPHRQHKASTSSESDTSIVTCELYNKPGHSVQKCF